MNNYLVTLFKQNNETEFDSTWLPNGNTKYSNAAIEINYVYY